MNNVCLVGNLTFDPELQYTQRGTAKLRMQIAVNYRKKTADGQWEDAADFPYITVWGKQAESCVKYLNKGAKVSVEAKVSAGRYTDDAGDQKYYMDIVARRVEFLTPKSGGGEPTSGNDEPPF